jgi:peptidyl-tRNA hydrolase, PTH2 family
MTDYNSPEAVEARANQEDPIIMYLIVRESLNMSIGKTAAQCAHASQMILLKYNEFLMMDYNPEVGVSLPPFSRETFDIIDKWLKTSFRKVVLKADDKEWSKLKAELNPKHFVLVIDAGLTEIEPGSETVIGVVPVYKSKCPKVIKRLQVLK